MKTTIRITSIIVVAMLMLTASCRKTKTEPEPFPNPTPNEEEVITTFKLILTDSATNTSATYMFKDPDGDGGQPAFYGPTSTTQTDSVFTLGVNRTYYGEIILLDETKNPVDSISNEVEEEGHEHMFFYNHGNNVILQSGNPYTVQMNGSGIKITYTDLDAGTPQIGIGITTRWRTYAAAGASKFPLNISLRHQPDAKNGTYAPGETDISVDFKVKVN